VIDRSFELFVTAIVVGAIGAFSPTRLAMSVVLLTGESAPWPRALAYAVGSTAVFSVVAVLGLLGIQATGLRTDAGTVSILLGLVMIAVAIIMAVQHRRQSGLPSQPPRHTLLSAAGLGAGMAIQSFGRLLVLLAGGYRIGVLSDNVITGLGFAAIMIAVWQISIWGPMVLYVFRRERFDALAERARPALDRVEGSLAGAIVVGAVGVVVLLQGLLA
jgi:hypothetical protein